MNKFIAATVLTISSAIATSAIAAPFDHHAPAKHALDHKKMPPKAFINHGPKPGFDDRRFQQSRFNQVNPSRHWRSGQYLPNQFNQSRFRISDRDAKRFGKTGRNEQWYKINGDYVLVNERNNKIIRIIG